uniref:Msx protein n=1 Tax=Ptychodera flava TaxID=63121 RepID=A0A0D3S1E0_PTYFL|nr:msx protein [Ptychodera flava]
MAFLSPAFSGDLAYFESRHTRAAFIPSTFYSPPTLPTFYNSSFTSNFIDFASSLHGPRYAVSSMERDQTNRHKQQSNAKIAASTSTNTTNSSSTSGSACSSSSSSGAGSASSPSTPQSCSKSFSIDSILGRTDSRDSEKHSNSETTQEIEKEDTTQTSTGQEDNTDTNDPMTRFSWLQCTRYKPPRLPRVKKKDGTKKRKLGRNPRVPFSAAQVAMLEQKFRRTHYLSSVDVAELSAALNLSENRVKIWFQNRRARERRDRENMEKSGVRGMSWTGQSTSGNPAAQFSQAVQEGTSAFTPVSYGY